MFLAAYIRRLASNNEFVVFQAGGRPQGARMGAAGMQDAHFIPTIGIVLLAALVGGLVAKLLRVPVLVGYLLAGVAIGPNTPGIIANVDTVRAIADVGVALLMFAVGVQFSLHEIGALKKTALIGGLIQIVGTIAIGFGLGLAFGWGPYGGIFLGCAIALSSTVVVMRVLEERGEMGSAHGGIMLAISVVQDLSLLLMATLLPTLGAGGAAVDITIALLKAFAFIGATLILATYAIPALLRRIVSTGSTELFVLTVVCLCLLAAAAAEMVGLGIALGAFLAGVVVSESPYSHEVFAQIRPLRDVFASLFFVSVGMLLNPRFLMEHWLPVGAVILAILVGKALVGAFGIYMAKWHGRTALLAGMGLAQIGEFSFVLAGIGLSKNVISNEVAAVITSSALLSLLIWPLYYEGARPLYAVLNRSRVFEKLFNRRLMREPHEGKNAARSAKVLILGGGRVGRYASDALRAKGVSHVVIDQDSVAIARLREHGVPIIYGDASRPVVLEQARPERAQLAIVALPEVATTELAVKTLKEMAPNLPVVARVRRGEDIPRMRLAGADTVIHGEFEAGVETIRQSLDRLGFPDGEVDTYIDGVRQHRYRHEE